MSVVISVADTGDADVFLSGWAFNELLTRVNQHPDADQDVRDRFDKAQALNGLFLENMPSATQRRVASILIDTAREMAAEMERPGERRHGEAAFAARLRELETVLERVYGSGRASPNGTASSR